MALAHSKLEGGRARNYDGESLPSILSSSDGRDTGQAHPHSDSLRRGAPRPNVRTAWSDVALHLVMLAVA